MHLEYEFNYWTASIHSIHYLLCLNHCLLFFSCCEVFVVALLPSPPIRLCFLFHQAATKGAATKFPSSAVFNFTPIMTCLGLGAGTTGPPRIPPSQGCEHLSVMSFLEVQCTKNITNYFEEFCKFYRISPCVRVGIFILNDSTCKQRIRCKCVVPTSFVFRRIFCAEQWLCRTYAFLW